MNENLDLVYLDSARELYNKILREHTEALALPSLDVIWILAGRCQLTNYML